MKKDPLVEELVDSYGDWFIDKPEDARAMTGELYPFEKMFSPITINKTKIKNRIVMAPMGNLQMCEENGRPNDKMIEYFTERAKGGCGLITTGLVPISHGIDPTITEPDKLTYFPRIGRSRTNLVGWRNLATSVHAYDSKLFIQLTPGLGRVGAPLCVLNELKLPVSASFNKNFYIPAIPTLRLSDRKLNRIIKNGAQAALDAQCQGIDGVYLHGHEGYLLEQMTNPAFNRRKLGKYRDPSRFGVDLVKAIRESVGPDYPIMYRIDLSLALNETYEDIENMPTLKKYTKGRTIADSLEFMKALVKAGVDCFDVDLGCYDNWWLPHPPSSMPAGCFKLVSKAAVDYFRDNNIKTNAGNDVVVVAVGKLGYPDLAEEVLKENMADMVMLGRQLLADPYWPQKCFNNQIEDIRPCIGCQEGCIHEFVLGGHIQCAVNGRCGFEDKYTKTEKARKIKKIAVVGAGPAGCVFALEAAKKGHNVTLFEAGNEVGGKLIPGGKAMIKFDIKNYSDYLKVQVAKAEEDHNLKVVFNKKIEIEDLRLDYDVLVICTGSKDILPVFPGLDDMPYAMATDVLLDSSILDGKDKIAIIGGGVVGSETAYQLAFEKNKQVDVLEMEDHFMVGICTANRGHLLNYMRLNDKVNLHNGCKVVKFENGKVIADQKTSKHLPDPYNSWTPLLPDNTINPLAKSSGNDTIKKEIETDFVLLALGYRPEDSLYYQALKEKAAPEIYNLGDSFKPAKILDAVRSAYALAMEI
ncbi:MAG TPA: NAD(P)/FAD-dependent oxidoreductase [Candidatus Eisenbacteria bacterium]|nr:NAD(P)/FAD-dependent oxidoreductase [Candidatus Eisenbacteria bacterium]